MNKPLRISHSAVNTYSTCGRKYQYSYIFKYRSNVISGALLFGRAIDDALNHLLLTQNLEESKTLFGKTFRWQDINKVQTYLPEATNVVYAKKDYDADLIFESDEEKFKEFKTKHNIQSDQTLKQSTAFYKKLKEETGFKNFTDIQKMVYNYGHWIALLNKGMLFLEAYNSQVLPQIKKVTAVQKSFSLKNSNNDEVIGYIDIIAEMIDGRIFVLDNKTSSYRYESDSPSKSQQLILYYHVEKEASKLSGAGFIVMYKQILKDRTKICISCNYDGSEGRHKTCPNEINGDRCNGQWTESVKLKAETEIILNSITEAAESLILDTFDLANEGIKKGVYNPNLNACSAFGKDFLCQYYKKCWEGKDDDLIKQ